jgi:DNA-binding LacI/PurR family transcriptional regulator
MKIQIDAPTVRRVAVVADADPRSVRRVIQGAQTRPSVRRRVLAALAELGIAPDAAHTKEVA